MFNVLIIEDDTADLKMLEHIFSELEVQSCVRGFIKGEEALVHLREIASSGQDLPNIILIDITLPGEDGIQILKRIKDNPLFGTIPIVVITGSSQKEHMIQTYKYGGIAFLRKPCDQERILDLISRLEVAGVLKLE